VATDGATIATTRYPKPLPNALCKIALYNGPPLPVAFDAWFRGTDLYWLTPLTSNKHPMTTSVNDRVVSKTSSEMDADLRLLLSAQVATEVCMNGRPATLKTWTGCNEAMHAARKHMAESDEAYVIGDYLLDLDGLRLNPNPPDPSTQ
jgi:hypothetical protein